MRRQDEPPSPTEPGAPDGAPPWVLGDAMQDMGGPDGVTQYRGDDDYRQSETAVHDVANPGWVADAPAAGTPPAATPSPGGQTFVPRTMIAPIEAPWARDPDRLVVDLSAPGAPVRGASLPDSGPTLVDGAGASSPPGSLPVAAGFAAPPAAIPVAEGDPSTQRLFAWLADRGVTPAYFTSYSRAREIIWGRHPDGPVDPTAVERAVGKRSPTSTPKQLQNLRDLGTLLVQYYGARQLAAGADPHAEAQGYLATEVLSPEPGGSELGLVGRETGEAAAAPPEFVELSLEAATGGLSELPEDLPAPVAASRPVSQRPLAPPAEPAQRFPTMEVELEVEFPSPPHATPVPKLLQESAEDMHAPPAGAAPRPGQDKRPTGEAPLVSLGSGARPTGEAPLVSLADPRTPTETPAASLGEEEVKVTYPDRPTWPLPEGFASAWDPRTRDQRPSEILRPPRPRWLTFGVPIAAFVAATVALVYMLGS